MAGDDGQQHDPAGEALLCRQRALSLQMSACSSALTDSVGAGVEEAALDRHTGTFSGLLWLVLTDALKSQGHL